MSRREVAVTGLGVIACNGIGAQDFWTSVRNGVGGAATIETFDVKDYPTRFACAVKGFDTAAHFDVKAARRVDRFSQFALVCARMAVKDSGLDLAALDLHRAGVIVGSGIGGIDTLESQLHTLVAKGPGRVSPFVIPKMILNMAAGEVSIEFGFRGPNFAISTACASSSHAVGEAAMNIRCGRADIMLAGGTEASITPLSFAGFCAIKALSTRNDAPARASRPFDRQRDGFVMGEGSAILVLEELEHARRRGAHVYGLLAGYGANADGFHITQPLPDGSGATRCMQLALEDAGLRPEQVDYINAHGTSTELNDKAETQAIKNVFGAHARTVSISSTKSMHGHTLGAAGAIEAAVCLLAMKHNVVPPTINYEEPDPDCDLDYTPNTAREKTVRVCQSNSFGFGGQNASLVFRKL